MVSFSQLLPIFFILLTVPLLAILWCIFTPYEAYSMTDETVLNDGNESLFYAYSGNISSTLLSPYDGQTAMVISPVNRNVIYTGTISYTATLPVDLYIYHIIDTNTTGIAEGLLTDVSGSSQDSGTLASSAIQPMYHSTDSDPNSISSFSATLPFSGNGLSLRSKNGIEPFQVVFSLGANLVKPSHTPPWLISSDLTMSLDNMTSQKIEGLATPLAYATTTAPSLLANLIPVIDPAIVAELPLHTLPVNEILQIIDTLPADKLRSLLDLMSADKREEMLNKIPEDKRNEILSTNPSVG